MFLFSHPTGNSNVRNALLALSEADLLKEFWTCLAWNADSRVNQLLPSAIRSQLCRRSFDRRVLRVTRRRPWREMGRLLSQACRARRLTRHESGTFCVDAVYRDLDTTVASRLEKLRGLTGVYAYEDGALETFREAEKLGLTRIYDLPIGYWRAGLKIQHEEAERNPEWASTMVAMQDSAEKFRRKDEEVERASRIVVASEFTRQTLLAAPAVHAPIDVIPYGAPEPDAEIAPRSNRRLSVLFVGSLTQRKGISYLFEAMEPLRRHADLTLIGQPAGMCRALDRALQLHAWKPSLAQPQLWAEMRRHDVLVLPSLFEGFGLVLLEAMARGVVVITTPHTAGTDIIQNGSDGFIVPIRSAEAIRQSLEMLVNDRVRLRAMSHAALRTARRFTWSSYRTRLIAAILEGSGVAAA